MIDKIENSYESENLNINREEKKSYSEPIVSKLGSMQKVTLGGSDLTPDSENGPGIDP